MRSTRLTNELSAVGTIVPNVVTILQGEGHARTRQTADQGDHEAVAPLARRALYRRYRHLWFFAPVAERSDRLAHALELSSALKALVLNHFTLPHALAATPFFVFLKITSIFRQTVPFAKFLLQSRIVFFLVVDHVVVSGEIALFCGVLLSVGIFVEWVGEQTASKLFLCLQIDWRTLQMVELFQLIQTLRLRKRTVVPAVLSV